MRLKIERCDWAKLVRQAVASRDWFRVQHDVTLAKAKGEKNTDKRWQLKRQAAIYYDMYLEQKFDADYFTEMSLLFSDC